MPGVGNEDQRCESLECHCAGHLFGCLACEKYPGVLCTVARSRMQSGHAKPVCLECIGCGTTRWCTECPEYKAREAARGEVCSPCMSGPACVPPEAAASLDPLEAAMQVLFHMQKAITLMEEYVLALKSPSPPQAAFPSNEAPLLGERAGAHLAPQGRTILDGELD